VLIFLLILLLIAAMTGVLGAVLEVTLVIVLSLVLSLVLLVWIGSWYAKRRFREFQQQFEASADRDRRRRDAYDVGTWPHDQNLRPEDGPGGPMIPRK
jgi:membrane protein implicated in regulation of membrane protease activity